MVRCQGAPNPDPVVGLQVLYLFNPRSLWGVGGSDLPASR